MRICDLIKNQDTYQADIGQTVLETVRAMVERNIGAVPVLHNGRLVGIFSERDLMKRVVAEGRDPNFRHLPICHEGKLVALVSLRDILLQDLTDKEHDARLYPLRTRGLRTETGGKRINLRP
jgi:CBS domain-containing protein